MKEEIGTTNSNFTELKVDKVQHSWWDKDWSEELTILALLALGICSLIWLGVKAETIINTITGGFLGYLVRASKDLKL